jgi:hypothetical protein
LKTFAIPLRKKLWFPSHNKGFAAVTAVYLLPILAIGFFAVSVLMFYTESLERRDFACQKAVLAAQKASAKPIDRLLKLNPVILGLRTALKTSYALLATATATYNAPLAAKATEQIISLKKQQSRIAHLQKTFISLAATQMNSAPARLMRSPQLQRPELLKGETSVSGGLYRPAVEANDSGTPPTYKLKNNFEQAQSVKLTWKSRWSLGDFQWLQNWLNFQKIETMRSCAGTLQSFSEGQFEPRLIRARF